MRRLRKILIVDDEPRIRALFHRQLKEAGYKVVETGDGEKALELLKDNRDINLVILDIVLPKTSGLDIFDVMRKDFPQIRIIISSVYTPDEQEFMVWDADDYYSKSDSISMLVDKVNKLLRL